MGDTVAMHLRVPCHCDLPEDLPAPYLTESGPRTGRSVAGITEPCDAFRRRGVLGRASFFNPKWEDLRSSSP